ncbi:MAG: multi-sensor signal transduction multi-kinase [Gemmatimonadetes bacterium]|nr:multi-sensor signal transduction multi-kinase [Gemmatimonadota bacterium]
MTELSAYEFSTLRGGPFTLSRGLADGLDPILVVAPAEEYPSLQSLRRLEHELALRPQLEADWAARPVELVRRDVRQMLVLEDHGGEPLESLLGVPLAVATFLHIAIPLAAALGRLHARGLIHKDVTPANILVNTATDGVWLTGFGIASRLPREHQPPAPPDVIAGTLAYMAPEQMGRMNRSVDSRSDLYALGVTFYEMLTGALPFTASDPMEWVYCHIARQPVAPSERVSTVPAQLSAIVLKLLAKTAEDRYQTAAGLAFDLRRCLADWEASGLIDCFTLATQDLSDRLVIPERLYGREREIHTLVDSFDRVVTTGAPELVIVSGYSGIGKSSVVNELHKVLVPWRGLFASGKFDQYTRDVPYATLAQAFQSLVRSLLGQSEAELGRWRDALHDALGQNGQLIVNLIPEIELVIGKQPPVPELAPQDAKNRFQLVFRRLIGVFARPEHPLALFLDDLQWLDAATLDLLEYLITHSEVRHLLLVGVYRDNEVGPVHPLLRTLEAIRKAGVPVQEIVLAPLGLDDVGQLIADALHCEPGRALPLAQLVQERTGGNPFFAIQFFTALAEEGLLAFDPDTLAWQWDMDRIRAKSYTDSVVDLMVAKLKRFSATTQEALKQLACLGNIADIATLALVNAETEERSHAALWEAVHAGLVFHHDSAFRFLHDRIQQAAYSLIPEPQRVEVHLRIGRVLLASMTANQLAEHLFDVASQFNRGAARLIDRDEKAQVATIDLRAGRKAKASAAYASACVYLAAGMALWDEGDWDSQYELTFSLWLERAQCELLSGNFDKAEQLIAELLQRAESKVDRAAVYQLKIQFHVTKSENPQAVVSALTCLRLFGIEMPAHPTFEQVQAEYETVWNTLGERPIESLIDLPLITDPELQAALQVLSVLTVPAYFTDFHFYCLLACRMVKVSMQYGTSGASAHAYGNCGFMLAPVFHRYHDAYRFAKLACDLVVKHGFITYQARVYHAMGSTAVWTQPIGSAIDYMRVSVRTAIETGELTYACYSEFQAITALLLRNDPLDAVWRESERALDLAREASYGDAADMIGSQQRFIATMLGQTASFSTFSDAQFDEATVEAQLAGDGMTMKICFFWILKLKARFLSGDYAEALAAADKVKPLLSVAIVHIQLLDYHYYAALAIAAVYETAQPERQQEWRDLLTAHREQLREWTEAYPPTFGDKHALVSAEIARLEGRDVDAMRLYEQAIQSAREHGFVQNEGTAHEVAARFYAARGFGAIADVYLRNARYCYLRWGADGKVRQLDELYPKLREHPIPASPTTIGALIGQLDVATVLKASQAVSGEIELGKLIETLMRIAIEHAGAERGLLILVRGDALQIVAEATTGHGRIEVTVQEMAVAPLALPLSALHYVIRSRESVVLDDASVGNPYSDDEYVRQKHSRSVLCLPVVKQTKLVGALYLENNLTPYAFTSDRVAVLELLASQAAISLDNARLYADLRRSEASLADAQQISHTGSWRWIVDTEDISWSAELRRMFGLSATDALPSVAKFVAMVHADDRIAFQDALERAVRDRARFEQEYRIELADGSIRHLHTVGRPDVTASGELEYTGVIMDITERRRADEALREAQGEVARVARLTTMGELAASITHEINQPLAAIVSNGGAGLRWLNREMPDLDEARQAFSRVVSDGQRAAEVIRGLRALAKKSGPQVTMLDIDDTIQEVLILTRSEMQRRGIVLRTELAASTRPVAGDRVQLQQVVLNLILNGIDAMSATADPRELVVSSALDDDGSVVVSVEDTGTGLDPTVAQRIFEPLFTTKPDGLGMGLSICRSIMQAHGGRLWATARESHGAAFRFALPAAAKALQAPRPGSESEQPCGPRRRL